MIFHSVRKVTAELYISNFCGKRYSIRLVAHEGFLAFQCFRALNLFCHSFMKMFAKHRMRLMVIGSCQFLHIFH